ncbi:MAG: hypothetical protein K0Q95_115 [Bacteroidota bacterium]|jgi:hypothetical protein|nr:hypothetical protein [Bacteroidota bacterium]
MNKKIFALLISTAFVLSSFAQISHDAGLWATFNLDKTLNKKFSLIATQEFRLRENFSRVNLFYTDLGVEYRPVKVFKAALSYRFIGKSLIDDNIGFRHRLTLDLTLRKKFGKVILAYRLRTQREVRDVQTSEDGYLPEWYSRHKFTLKVDLDKPIQPYIATELRYQIVNPRMQESDGLWHRARYIAGIDYKKSDKHTFGLYYLMQREFEVPTPQYLYIVGIEYTLSL